MRIVIFCILSILGGSSVAMDEPAAPASSSSSSSSPARLPHFSPLVDPIMGGKRAYTYRSEYKRLPLYQFGLGKRWVQSSDDKRAQPFSFGLGKRTRPYSFGLGKRSGYDDFGYLPNDLYDAYAQKEAIDNYLKRSGGFNFGLGKRDAELSEEMRDDGLHEKLPAKHSRDKYMFGLGKRLYEDEDEDAASLAQLE